MRPSSPFFDPMCPGEALLIYFNLVCPGETLLIYFHLTWVEVDQEGLCAQARKVPFLYSRPLCLGEAQALRLPTVTGPPAHCQGRV